MRAACDQRLSLEEFQTSFTRHIDLCLACRACETACPSGVPYGALVETARVAIERNRTPGNAERFLRWLGLKKLLPNLALLRLVARLMWAYEKLGFQRLARASNFLPSTLQAMESILPPIEPQYTALGSRALAQGQRRGRVLFFTGCIQEAFLGPVNRATLRVLQHNGYEVFTPRLQTCCGAAHLHLGEIEQAKSLARKNIDACLSQPDQYEAIICNAGGCGLSLKEYPHLLQDDPAYAQKAKDFSARVQDISEFLCDHLHTPPGGGLPMRAVYVDSCHLRHGQKVTRQPRELLHQVPGLILVELSAPDRCCGSAGVYNLTHVETAETLLEAKMADITAAGAELIVTSNTGCHLQLIAGARKANLAARVMHVVEVLDQSYRAAERNG
jgi:glycolate oxidase iron-sulfur subunit